MAGFAEEAVVAAEAAPCVPGRPEVRAVLRTSERRGCVCTDSETGLIPEASAWLLLQLPLPLLQNTSNPRCEAAWRKGQGAGQSGPWSVRGEGAWRMDACGASSQERL